MSESLPRPQVPRSQEARILVLMLDSVQGVSSICLFVSSNFISPCESISGAPKAAILEKHRVARKHAASEEGPLLSLTVL